jgi:2-iminobutanoate/2-iminopropanoate deaminase
MPRTTLTLETIKTPPYYSHAVTAGGLVFVSGIGAFDQNGAVVGTTIGEQTARALQNISDILQAAGSSLARAVSATIILADGDADWAGFNEEWERWFPIDQPARQAAQLPVRVPGLKISIALIAEA